MKPRIPSRFPSLLILALSALSAPSALAASWFWDADGATTTATGGAGSWTQAGVLWRNGSATGTLTAYNNASGPQNDTTANLVLAGGVDSVTMTLTSSTAYNLNTITANNTYTLATNTATATFVGTTPTVNTVSGKSLVWGIDLSAASATVIKSGTGTWQWNNTGAQVVSASTTLDVQAGTLQVNTSAASSDLFSTAGTNGIVKVASGAIISLNQSNNGGYTSVKNWTLGSKLTLNGGTLNGGSSNGALFQRIPSTTAIQVDASSAISQATGNFSQNFVIEGDFTGSGALSLNRAASSGATGNRYLNLKGSMSGYSGNVTIGTSTSLGYVLFGNSTGWGTGSLTLSGAGSRVVIGDEAATAYNAGWTGGSGVSFVSGTFAPAGAITLSGSSELRLMNGSTNAILFSPAAGITVNGGTLSNNGTAGTSAYVPAASTTWTFGGSAVSTISGRVQVSNTGVTFQVADAVAGSGIDTVISGALSGTNGFTKTGAGALQLTGTTAYSGATSISAGVLEFGTTTTGTLAPGGSFTVASGAELRLANGASNSILFSPVGAVTVNGGKLSVNGTAGTSAFVPAASSTWTFGGSALSTVSGNVQLDNTGVTFAVNDAVSGSGVDAVVSGLISGANGLTKSGAGTLQLSSANTFAGPLTISAGSVLFNSSTDTGLVGGLSGNGSIAVSGTGLVTLSGSSSGYTGTVTVADGASLGGEADTSGPLVIGSSTGAKLFPDASTPTAAFTATDVTLNGVTPIVFANQPPAGTYTILKYTGTLTGSAANLSANYRGASLNTGSGSNSEITLTIGNAVSLIWNNAAATDTWATGSAANWLNGVGSDVFYTADNVTFDDTPASNQSITVTGTVAPGSVTFNNSSRDYSISGGAITGLTSVVKGGSAIATLASANSYSGGTTLNDGTLRVGDAAALGTAALTINGGTLSSKDTTAISIPNAIIFNNGATLGNATDNGILTLSGAVSLASGLDVTTSSDVVFSGVVSGSGNYLGKQGTGTLTVTGTNTYGSTFVDDGTLQVGNGGTAGVLPGAAVVTSPGTLRYFRSDTPTLSNAFSGSGTLAFKGTGTSNQSSYTLTGNNSSLTGTLSIESGARVSSTTANQLGAAANVNVASGGQAFLNGGTYPNAFNIAGNGWTETAGQLGALRITGSANITGPVTLTADARISPYSGSGTISGSLTGTNNLEINATTSASFTGTLTYSGNGSAFTGATTVSQGTLNLTGSLGGAVNVSSTSYAATLSGEGSIAGNLTLGAVGKGAGLIINPVTSGALTVTGTLNVAEPGTVTAVSLSPAPSAVGTYTLINHGGTSATAANFSLAGYRSPVFDTTTIPNAVTVSISSGSLVWKGNSSAAWDVNTTANWENSTPAADSYFELDAVTFNDSATSFAPTLAGTVNPSSITFNNSTSDYNLTGAGVIAGPTGLTKSGSASVTLSTPNTYTGNVTVNAGKLILGNAAALGSSTSGAKIVTVNSGGQIDLNGQSPTARTYSFKISGIGDGLGALVNSSSTSIASNAGILNLELLDNATVGGSGRFDIGLANGVGGLITGNGKTLTKIGAGQVSLRGDASATPITIQVNAGSIVAENSDNAFGGTTGSISVANNATIGTNGVRTIATPIALASGATLSNTGGGTATWTGEITTDGTVTVNPGGQTVNLDGIVSGTGGITVPANGGTLNFNGTPSFTGGLIVGPTSAAATTVNLPAGKSLSVASGKTVQVGNTSASGTFIQTLNIDGSVTNAGALHVGRPGVLNLNSGSTWSQSGNSSVNGQGGYDATMNVLSGASFTYTGTSTFKLNGAEGNFARAYLNVTGGTLTTSAGFEQTTTPTTGFGQLALASGGTLKLGADVAQLTSNTRIILGTGGGVIDTNGFSASASFGITGTGNGLTKSGAGTLTLTGTNTYTGATTVNGGTLAGTGASGSAFTVSSGATLSPGTTVGTMSAAGTTFSNGSTFKVEINSSTVTADKLVSTGPVSIGTTAVSFSDLGSGAITAGTKLTIIDYTGSSLTGTFTGYAEGATVTIGTKTFTISYTDSSKVTLTATAAGYTSWASTNVGGAPANVDTDGDGVLNGVEYFMGQTGSSFTVNPSLSGGSITWPKDPTAVATYVVQTSTDLSTWNTATTGVNDTGSSVIYTIPTGDPARFARLKVTVP